MSAWHQTLLWIEASTLGEFIRASGVWTYGIINLIHILGIALLFGSVVILDLRLMGWRSCHSLGVVAGITVPIAQVGFALAAFAGIALLATNASEYIGNPFLPIKFVAVGLALVNVAVLSRLPAWKAREQTSSTIHRAGARSLAIAGMLSLILWLTAIAAGRLIGYW